MLKDSEIRAALKAKIQDGLAEFYTGQSPAVDVNVYGYWVLAHRDGESAALLRVRTGRDAGKVHTWMIGSDSSRITRSDMHGKDPVAFAMTGGLKKSGVNRRDVLKSFKIWAYLEYNDDGDEVDNSENALTEEVEYIVNYLAKFPTLGLTDSSLQGCMPMQIEEMEIVNYGEILANVAFCSIDVVMFKSVT